MRWIAWLFSPSKEAALHGEKRNDSPKRKIYKGVGLMYLNDQDRAVFFRLYFDLLYCANKEHGIVSDLADGRHPKIVDSAKAYQVREKIIENPSWIDEYIELNQTGLSAEDQEILLAWQQHFVRGKFLLMRYLAKFAVFMTTGDEDSTRLYGVTGLSHQFEDVIPKANLPMMFEAIILPFRDKIIYDGLISPYSISFGPEM
jgi:hypothetical protein